MEIKAKLKYLHIAPRKTRAVADVIKSKPAAEAEVLLKFLRRRASAPILKLLESAIANAKHNFNIEKNKLTVKSIRVDQGPVMKRFMPRARGMTAPIKRRQSHVSIILTAND